MKTLTKLCPICFAPSHSPFRMWEGDKIIGGCVDDFHTGHLVVPSQSASFHNRTDAKTIRAENKKAAKVYEHKATKKEISAARQRGKDYPNLPDAYCISLGDGDCVGGKRAGLPACLHDD